MIRRTMLTAALGLLFLTSCQTANDSVILSGEASQMEERHLSTPQTIVTSPLSSLDAELANLIPSYVGLSTDEKGVIRIAVADAQEFNQAKQVADLKWREINKISEDQATSAPIIIVEEAALPPEQLAEAKRRMRDVLNLPNAVFLAIDESCGCIIVGVTDATAETDVKAFAIQKGVPASAVRTIVTSPIRRSQNLDSSHRPTKGGMKIRSAPRRICTLGLPVFHNAMTRKGFLTASHCTEGNQGGSQGTWFAQPGGAWFWGDKVGTERLDPFLFDSTQDSECPAGRLCRRSDAAFVEYDQGTLGFVGRIARPSATCATPGMRCGIAMPNWNFDIRVASVATPPVQGELVDKIGRTTGWTRGAVLSPCNDEKVGDDDGNDTGVTMLCQYVVAAMSDKGDSGAPVFVFDAPSGTAKFAGILWGIGEVEGGDNGLWGLAPGERREVFSFSPVSALNAELGGMEFYESAPASSSSPALSPREQCQAACDLSLDSCMVEAHTGRERGACVGESKVCQRECPAT